MASSRWDADQIWLSSPPILGSAAERWPMTSPPRDSGSYDTSAGLASFGLTNALLWNALNFTKPPGVCGGQTGYWADAPHS